MGKPRLILIIRHAQSEGNKDKTIHQGTPDHKVGLTSEGHQQAREAGEKLRALLRNDDTLHFFISPYRRTRETTEGILAGLCANSPAPSPFQRPHIKVYEEPRLREQDFGNFQPGTEEVERLWRERADYGHFFYRIPNGESGADVYDRMTSFNASLWRRFSEDDMASVAVLVTHGLCSRVFLMAWYHYSVEFFEDLRNINHCEFLVMRHGANGRYVLQNELRRWSDLRRERAARKSISAPSPTAEINIPVRRWGSTKSGHDGTGRRSDRRPIRQSTADMFRDDTADRDEDLDNEMGAEFPVDGDLNQSQPQPIPKLASSRNAHSPLREAFVPDAQQPRRASRIKSFLGRDGGGSRSGAASPLTASEDDDSALDTPVNPNEAGSETTPKPIFQPRSLAKALRGDLDNPNRVLADALGDQSDAEVDEADKEAGTKQKAQNEMRQILEDERRERSHGGSVY